MISPPTNWKVPEKLQLYQKSSNACCHKIRASPLSQADARGCYSCFRLFIYLPTCLEQIFSSCSSWAAKLEDLGQGANKRNSNCII